MQLVQCDLFRKTNGRQTIWLGAGRFPFWIWNVEGYNRQYDIYVVVVLDNQYSIV